MIQFLVLVQIFFIPNKVNNIDLEKNFEKRIWLIFKYYYIPLCSVVLLILYCQQLAFNI